MLLNTFQILIGLCNEIIDNEITDVLDYACKLTFKA